MGKWVGRLFYAVLIIFMTFFIIQSAYDTRSNAYLADNMTNEWDNEPQFFKGINTLLNLDYITSDPIIPAYVDNTGAHRMKLQIYGIGYTDADGNHLDGLMIYINDVVIYEADTITGFMTKIENPYIKLTIYTDEVIDDEPVYYSGFEGQNFAAGFIFDQTSSEIAYDLTTEDGSLANITRIDVDYSNGSLNDGALVYQTESLMIVANQVVDDPVFDDSFKFSDFSYDPESYRLQDDLTTWPVTDQEADDLNLFIARDDLSAYNWEMIRVYLLFAGFVIIVTYLLFFHKKVMTYFRERHGAKNAGNPNDPIVVDAKPADPIFKDPEPDQEDGK